jgi:Protein of unknown function (DUF3105)
MAKNKTTLPKTNPGRPTSVPASAPSRTRLPVWAWVVLGAVAIAALAGLLLLMRPGVSEAAPGERFPIQGQQHIDPGTTHPPYNSDPPTSGWHYPEDLKTGFYEEPYPDEMLVHNLEHGHIVISYDCTKLADCETVKQQIRSLMADYDNWKVTAVPRQNKDAALAVTAWGWLLKLDGFDETRIRAFVDAWRDHGPEATME